MRFGPSRQQNALGLGLGVYVLGFRVAGSWFRVSCFGFRVVGFWLWFVLGLGFRVLGLGFRV